MNSTVTGAAIAAIAGAVVALIQFMGQRGTAKTTASNPASVADGYGKLVADLRADLNRTREEVNRLRVEVAECERRHEDARDRIAHLEQLVERRSINRGHHPGEEQL
jgi:chromosome segregation ATPase